MFFTNWYFNLRDSLSENIMFILKEFYNPTALKGIVLSTHSLLRYDVTFRYLCDGYAASVLGRGDIQLGLEKRWFIGKTDMPEKQVFKPFAIFRKTSHRNTREVSCPQGLWRGIILVTVYFPCVCWFINSKQPHNYVIVTRLIDGQSKSPEGQKGTLYPTLLLLFSYF